MRTLKTKFKYASTQCAYKQTEIGMIPEEWEAIKKNIPTYLKLHKRREYEFSY